MAGEDDRAGLVAVGDELEEQAGGGGVQGQVADLVDDQQPVAVQSAQLGGQGAAVVGGGEPVQPAGGAVEQDRVAGFAALIARLMARSVLPNPGGPSRTTFSLRGMKVVVARWAMVSRAWVGRWVKVKSSRVFTAGRCAPAIRSRVPLGGAGGDLAGQHSGQVGLVGSGLGARLVGQGGEHVGDDPGLELLGQ